MQKGIYANMSKYNQNIHSAFTTSAIGLHNKSCTDVSTFFSPFINHGV